MIESPTLSFLPGIAEKLGYYVYALRDPKTKRIFYVGKGKGNRVYQHAARARRVNGETADELKLETIRKIHDRGEDVLVEIIRHGLTDKEAYEAEAAVIDTLRRLLGYELANQVLGKWARSHGWEPLDELRASYGAPPVVIDGHRVVLIRINKEFRAGMSDAKLYKATRQWWVMSPRRAPEWAFAVYNGIVRAVYRIDPKGWERSPDGRPRWRFAGTRDPELEVVYAWKDVSAYLPAGAQNPIRYVNC